MSRFIEEVAGTQGAQKMITEVRGTPTNKQLTQLILDQWRNSDVIKAMLMANEYYHVRNKEILSKQRTYQDAAGNTIINESLSNVQIPSAFLRMSVQQKVNYAFGKPFLLNVENVTMTADEQKSDANADIYSREWQNFIDVYTRKTIKRLAKNAVNNGIGWAYVWINGDGELTFVDVDSETIYPQWADRAHLELDVIVRDYKINVFEDDASKIVNKVEYWDKDTVERFIDDGGLNPDTETPEGEEELPETHMRMGDNGISWGRVPFIALKGNEDELPLLNAIKAQIDAYDALQSKTVDSLIDDIDPVIVLKNISAEIGGLVATRNLLKSSRIAALDENGDASYLQVNTDISATEQKLEHLRKDIREFSFSVDTQDVKFGSNPSGVALKAMYQDLDIYVEGLEMEFEVFIEGLKYFFDRWLEFRQIGTVEQWADYRVIVTLDRDMMINNSALIDDTVKLAALVSQETLDNYNPAVENHEVEQARREAESQAELERKTAQSELYAFEEARQNATRQGEQNQQEATQ